MDAEGIAMRFWNTRIVLFKPRSFVTDTGGWRSVYGDLRDFIGPFLVRDEYGRNQQEEIRAPRWQEDDFQPYAPIVQGIIDLCREHREQVFDCCKATVVVTFFLTRNA